MSTNTEDTKKHDLTLNLVMVEFIDTQKDLEDLQGEIEVTRQGRSNHLLQVAKTFNDKDAFLTACKVVEDALTGDGIRVQDKGEVRLVKLDKVPRAWIQAKSNIKRAFEYVGQVIPDDKRDLPNKGKKLNLADFTNEYDLRTAVRGIRNPVGAESDKTVERGIEALEFGADLQDRVSQFLACLHKLSEDEAKGLPMAVKLLDDSLAEVRGMLNEILPIEPISAKQSDMVGERATA